MKTLQSLREPVPVFDLTVVKKTKNPIFKRNFLYFNVHIVSNTTTEHFSEESECP